MNKRIVELMEQARVQDRGYFIYQYGGPTGHQSVEKAIDLEKFAELIVRECIDIVKDVDKNPYLEDHHHARQINRNITKRFGIQ